MNILLNYIQIYFIGSIQVSTVYYSGQQIVLKDCHVTSKTQAPKYCNKVIIVLLHLALWRI